MSAAVFVVRATVSDPAKREAFGTWYSREHLPDAMKSFGANMFSITMSTSSLKLPTRPVTISPFFFLMMIAPY